MAITFVASGASAIGTTSIAPPLPTGLASGDALLVVCASKLGATFPVCESTAGSWTSIVTAQVGTLGTGALPEPGAASGTVRLSMWWRQAGAAETVPTVTQTGTGATGIAYCFGYRKAAGDTWALASCGGATNQGTTTHSVATPTNPGITSGDVLLHLIGLTISSVSRTSGSISATGIAGTYAVRTTLGTTGGNDVRIVTDDLFVTSGTATAAPVGAGTLSAASAGGSAILRLRAVTAPATGFTGWGVPV